MKKYVVYFTEHKQTRSVNIQANDIEHVITKCKIAYHCTIRDIFYIEEVGKTIKL